MDNLSVLIRCRNEERWIGHSIQSVIDTFENPEIVVVDNGSTDNSKDVVQMFKKGKFSGKGSYADIKTYDIDGYTPGKSLNFGIEKCSKKIILILSAHSVIQKCNLIKIKDKLNKYCVVGAKQIPIYKGKKISRRYVWANFMDDDYENHFSKGENRYFLHNAFCFYEKNVLKKYPFDELLHAKEDRYWVNDMIEKGFSSYYDSETICHHHYTNNCATWKGIG